MKHEWSFMSYCAFQDASCISCSILHAWNMQDFFLGYLPLLILLTSRLEGVGTIVVKGALRKLLSSDMECLLCRLCRLDFRFFLRASESGDKLLELLGLLEMLELVSLLSDDEDRLWRLFPCTRTLCFPGAVVRLFGSGLLCVGAGGCVSFRTGTPCLWIPPSCAAPAGAWQRDLFRRALRAGAVGSGRQHLVACQVFLAIGAALRCFAGTIGWVLVLYLVVDVRRVRAVGATCRPCGETGRTLHVACLVLEEWLHEGCFIASSAELGFQ